jgi:hypothetical protein
MTDDFAGKAVIFVALDVGRRGHVWLPILVCDWSCGESSLGVSIS